MPELPEVEITARLLDRALAGAVVESALAPGINTLKTLRAGSLGARWPEPDERSPPRQAVHRRLRGRPRAPDPPDVGRATAALRHARGPRDRTSRLLFASPTGASCACASSAPSRRAWAKLLRADEVDPRRRLASLGPDAWPDPPRPGRALDQPRPLYALLRDQHVLAGIGRSWVDEILWTARISPFKRGADLSAEQAGRSPTRSGRRSVARSSTTSRRSRCRYPTSCLCRCRFTATPASLVRAARRRSSRSASRTTCSATARTARPRTACSRTAACRGCSSSELAAERLITPRGKRSTAPGELHSRHPKRGVEHGRRNPTEGRRRDR